MDVAVVIPETATGVEPSVVVPLPSWPLSLAPQQWRFPAVCRGQLWSPPAAISITVLMAAPATGVGLSVFVPSPSWPCAFAPQHRTVPARRAQEWEAPASIAVAVVIPDTATGVELSVVDPSPSWPLALSPQHLTDPGLPSSAQVWLPPAAIAVAVVIPETVTGVRLGVVDPSPSWPRALAPQHLTVPPVI